MTKKYCATLTIAGTDPSGGAGIQADLKTFSALKCYGMAVITALVAQNTCGVQDIHTIPAKFIKTQLDSIFDDIEVAAVKIGMLHNAEVIQVVADALMQYQPSIVVLDPVMTAKSGNLLLQPEAVETMRNDLFPRVNLITPNLTEAEYLLRRTISGKAQMELAAKELANESTAVLLKGGHSLTKTSDDCLYQPQTDDYFWFNSPRIQTNHTHGTGCTLASAITAYLAQGHPLQEAVAAAKLYISSAIQAGADYQLGQGNGPVHHFYALWD